MSKTKKLCWCFVFVAGLFVPFNGFGDVTTVSPEDVKELNAHVGQIASTIAILDTQGAVSSGVFGWHANEAEADISNMPWQMELFDPKPLGDSGLEWAPVFQGGIGYGEFTNRFRHSDLKGNESIYKTWGLSLGGGPRFYVGHGFSVLPAFELMGAYTKNHFRAINPYGKMVAEAAENYRLKWDVYTLTYIPSFELRYCKTFGRWTPEITSVAVYYHTIPVKRSTKQLDFKTDSVAWTNKLDLDYRTDWKIVDCPVHFGVVTSRTELYQDLETALNSDYYYYFGGRITLKLLGKFWFLEDVGFSGGYFLGKDFDGYSYGVEGNLKF